MQNIGLVGFGRSNYEVYRHFSGSGCKIFVHLEKEIPLPDDALPVFGKDYLKCDEDLVFRSPGVRPDKIIAREGSVVSEASYSLPRFNIPKILVTGSDGKTTTATMIAKILKDDVFLSGNIGTPFISGLGSDYKYLVGELSSFQLMDFYPNSSVSVITGFTENHLNWHTDIYEYFNAKLRIAKNAERIVIPYDNEKLREATLGHKNISYFSLNDLSHLDGNHAYLKNNCLYIGKEPVMAREELPLLGDFNVLNALSAICATYGLCSVRQIRNGLSSFYGVENRLEPVRVLYGVSFFNSSIDTTPSRTATTVGAVDIKRTVLILGGSDKGLSYEILKEALKNARGCVVLGENKNKILPNLACPAIAVSTLKEAVLASLSLAREGDNVILSPASASFDMFSSYKERGCEFKRILNELL